jgi:hypothetical protein
MEAKIRSKHFDNYIMSRAFLFSTFLMLMVWFLEEGRHDFGFLWSGEIVGFLMAIAFFTSLMVGAYFALQKWMPASRKRLLWALFIGGLPAFLLLIVILSSSLGK